MIDEEEVDALMRLGGWAMMRLRQRGPSTALRIMDYGPVPDPFTEYGYTPEDQVKLTPTAREIALMDEVTTWLGFIPDDMLRPRQVVALRMLWNDDKGRWVWTYRRLGEKFHTSHTIVKIEHGRGVREITRHLRKNIRLLDRIALFRIRKDGA